jgi:DNA-binding transcriptional ArsR family regulator
MRKKCCGEGEMNLPDDVSASLRACGGLEGLRGSLSSEGSRLKVAAQHAALSDPIRLSLLESLQYCDLCPCVLREVAGLTNSKLSYHLKLLEEAELLTWRQSGNWRIYSLTPAGRISLIGLRRMDKE